MNFHHFNTFLATIKTLHWKETSHHGHVILGALYKDLEDKFDEIVECVLGSKNISIISQTVCTQKEIKTEDMKDVATYVAEEFNTLYSTMSTQQCMSASHIQSLFDDAANIVSRACYLLKMK